MCVTNLLCFCVGIQYLNTDHGLYEAVKRAEQDGHLLTTEAHRAAHHLRIDFEKGGIHLSSGMRPVTVSLSFSRKINSPSFSTNFLL